MSFDSLASRPWRLQYFPVQCQNRLAEERGRKLLVWSLIFILRPSEKNANGGQNCQKWDSNPRPHTWTRTLTLHFGAEGVEPWVWRLRPLGQPDRHAHDSRVSLINYYHVLVCNWSGCSSPTGQKLSAPFFKASSTSFIHWCRCVHVSAYACETARGIALCTERIVRKQSKNQLSEPGCALVHDKSGRQNLY